MPIPGLRDSFPGLKAESSGAPMYRAFRACPAPLDLGRPCWIRKGTLKTCRYVCIYGAPVDQDAPLSVMPWPFENSCVRHWPRGPIPGLRESFPGLIAERTHPRPERILPRCQEAQVSFQSAVRLSDTLAKKALVTVGGELPPVAPLLLSSSHA